MKPCLRTVTPSAPPLVGMPSFDIQERNGYSLPKNQTPSVLPLKSSGLVMPVSLRQVSSRPELLERLGDVDERHALLAGGERRRHPVDDHVGAAAGDHLLGRDVGAARLDRDVEALFLVEALVLGDVVAGELRLGDPFELQRHRVGGRAAEPQAERRAAAASAPNSACFIDPSPCRGCRSFTSGRTDARTCTRAR